MMDICEETVWNSPDLENLFFFFLPRWNCHILPIGSSDRSQKIIAGLIFLCSLLLTYSRIWLIPLGDDFQCGYVTKARKFKEKKKNRAQKTGIKL
jgi:hypothetical protein